MSIRVRRSAATEAIATYLCWDIDEICECAYQPTLLFKPYVFTIGEDYVCSPSAREKPPVEDRDGEYRGFSWKEVYSHRGRKVYRSHRGDMKDQ